MASPKRIGPFKEPTISDRMSKARLFDILNQYENMVEGRGNIGARNPLVLANQKLGLLDLDSLHGRDSLERLLKDAFGNYEELFDPLLSDTQLSDSPVYMGLFEATLRLSQELPGKRIYSDFLKKMPRKSPEPEGPGALPAGMPESCQEFIPDISDRR